VKASKPVIHGRDHSHGGADPVGIAYEDGGGAATGAWTDLVTSLAPVFWIDFQDDIVSDGQFTDVTGHGHTMTRAGSGAGLLTRTNEAHMFAYQSYSGKTSTSDSAFGVMLAGTGLTWGNGLTAFTVEVWFRLIAGGGRGYLIGNNDNSNLATNWGFGFNATGYLYLKRFSAPPLTTAVRPAANVWHQFLATSDGTTCTVYVDGAPQGSVADVAGNVGGAGGLLIIATEVFPGSYAAVSGYWGGLIGYASFMTAAQVWDLYQAGLASGNPGGV
jgi:hypothetical protein